MVDTQVEEATTLPHRAKTNNTILSHSTEEEKEILEQDTWEEATLKCGKPPEAEEGEEATRTRPRNRAATGASNNRATWGRLKPTSTRT